MRCAACGKTTQEEVPWARAGSGFSVLMEALIVTLCQAMTVRQVAQLLGVSAMRLWRTLDHYVDQARAQEDFSAVAAVGLDETAARRGHDDISLFHDLDAGRLVFACEGRKAEVVAHFADDLDAHWDGILNAFDSKLTNGRVEAANSLIQAASGESAS